MSDGVTLTSTWEMCNHAHLPSARVSSAFLEYTRDASGSAIPSQVMMEGQRSVSERKTQSSTTSNQWPIMLTNDELCMATAGEGHLHILLRSKDLKNCLSAVLLFGLLVLLLGVQKQSNRSPCVTAELDNGNSYW